MLTTLWIQYLAARMHDLTKTRVQCPNLGVLFSLTLDVKGKNEDIIVASGTVFGKIVIWKIPTTSSTPVILSHLTDHEGVIFRMKWNSTRTRLASVSDDRSVRLWDVSPLLQLSHAENVNDESLPVTCSQIFVGWGHISRVWDVCFLYGYDNFSVATCSEDSTIRIWNETGDCIVTMRGHDDNIWCLVTGMGQ